MKNIMYRLIAIRVILLLLTTPIIAQPIDNNFSLTQKANKTINYSAEKQIKIAIDGQEKSFSFQLYNSKRYGITPAFVTYAPSDFREDLLASGEGLAVMWTSLLDKQEEELAFISVSLPNFLKSEMAGRELIKDIATSRGNAMLVDNANKNFAWSLAEYQYLGEENGKKVGGTVVLGKHGKKFFTVLIQQPVSYKKEFLPLATQILAEWTWQDTGQGF